MQYTIEQAKEMTASHRAYLRRIGHDVPILPKGVPVGYKQSPEHVEKRKRFGPSHHSWVGDSASVRTGRGRAIRKYPGIGPCVMCGKKKSERHYADGNTLNNKPSNIVPLCRKCHMVADGRLAKYAATGLKNLRAANERRRRQRESVSRSRKVPLLEK